MFSKFVYLLVIYAGTFVCALPSSVLVDTNEGKIDEVLIRPQEAKSFLKGDFRKNIQGHGNFPAEENSNVNIATKTGGIADVPLKVTSDKEKNGGNFLMKQMADLDRHEANVQSLKDSAVGDPKWQTQKEYPAEGNRRSPGESGKRRWNHSTGYFSRRRTLHLQDLQGHFSLIKTPYASQTFIRSLIPDASKNIFHSLKINAMLKYLDTTASESHILNKNEVAFPVPNHQLTTLRRLKRFVDPLSLIDFGLSIYSIIQGIDSDIESERNFRQVFEGLDRNYNAIRDVGEKVQRNFIALKLVSEVVSKTLSIVERTRIEMHQGFNRVLETLKKSAIEPTVSHINNFVQYFVNQKERIGDLPQNELVAALQEQNGILQHLKNSRMPKANSLYTLLYDIIRQRYAIPQNADDEVAFSALYALYYGTQTFVSVMFFLLEQYSYLADYHYRNNDLDNYNLNLDLIQINFQDFKHTLVSGANGSSLLDSVIDVFNTVQSKGLITSEKDFIKLVSNGSDLLTPFKRQLEEMKLPIISDVPTNLKRKPSFTEPIIRTPMGKWVDGAEVRYAIQYKDNDTYSKVGEWSNPSEVREKANPLIYIPFDPSRRTRLVFRKFNNDKPELVGVLQDPNQMEFRDIDRDVFNAAARYDEDIGIKELDVLLSNGGHIDAVFEKNRSAIHAAAEASNIDLARSFLLGRKGSDINAKDADGLIPLHIAAEIGNEGFVELLVEHGADVNAKTQPELLTPLHIAADNGVANVIEALLKSDVIDVNARDKNGFVPLHTAAVSGGVLVTESLISDNRTDVNAKSEDGLTPLHLASMNNFVDVVEVLLRSDQTDTNMASKGKLTALHIASMNGYLEVARVLSARPDTDVNAQAANNWTSLHFATTFKRSNIVSELLKVNSTDVNAKGEKNITVLHISAATGQKAVSSSFLAAGALIDEKTDEGLTALHLASMQRIQEIVVLLVRRGASIRARENNGMTPLLSACYSRNSSSSVVEYLLESGSQVDATTHSGETCIQLCARRGNLDVFKYVSENVSSIDVKDDNNKTLLHYAAEGGNMAVLMYLVKDKVMDVNAKDNFGDTPTHTLAKYGSLEMFEYFVNQGANVSIKNNASLTPFYLAVRRGNLGMVRFLITEKNYDVNGQDFSRWLAMKWSEAMTHDTKSTTLYWAVCDAVQFGRLDILKYFAKSMDADSYSLIKSKWYYQVQTASKYGHLDVVKYLFEQRFVSINDGNKNSTSPLVIAGQYGHLDIVKYLLERGADVNSKDPSGSTPLHWAAFGGHLNVVKYFVETCNTDINAKDGKNRTSLHYAIMNGKLDAVKYLIGRRAAFNANDLMLAACFYGYLDIVKYMVKEHHADVEMKGLDDKIDYLGDGDGKSVMLEAAKQGRLCVVKYLVEKGVGVDGKDSNGKTALHYAAEYLQAEVVKFLVEKGSDFNAQDNDGQTALHLVITRTPDCKLDTFVDILKFLFWKGADIGVKDKKNNTPLSLGIYKCTNLPALFREINQIREGRFELRLSKKK